MATTTHQSVRRSLFGPVDHEQLRREVGQRLKEMSEQDSRRWNFDFQTDTPLAGRFQWEEVPLDSSAALYRGTSTTVSSSGTETGHRLRAADQENCSSISNTRRAAETPARRKRARSRSVDKSAKCARITGERRIHDAIQIRIDALERKVKCTHDCKTNGLSPHVQISSPRGGGRRRASARRVPSTKVAQKLLCAKQ